MNTQLKKGDKCQSPWGVVEVDGFNGSYIDCIMPNGKRRWIDVAQLTRIPTHAERMQAVLDIAWGVENCLEGNETVQLKVGDFVEFARHYDQLRESIIDLMRGMQDSNNQAKIDMEKAEKLLKGETTI